MFQWLRNLFNPKPKCTCVLSDLVGIHNVDRVRDAWCPTHGTPCLHSIWTEYRGVDLCLLCNAVRKPGEKWDQALHLIPRRMRLYQETLD
jgi:hypothetical protein